MDILLTKADKFITGAAKNVLLKVQSDIRKGWGDATYPAVFRAKAHGSGRRLYCIGGLDGAGGQRFRRLPSKALRQIAGKTPDFYGEGEVPGLKFRPLGGVQIICQHLTQHRSIEGLHQPFSNSESQLTGLVPQKFQIYWK